MSGAARFGWLAIVRLGLVQAAIGAVVVLTTSTLNRVMVVEGALPALVPGLLIGLHYGVQFVRPRMGFGADAGGRSTPWIVGGMAVLALGGFAAAVATAWALSDLWPGLALAAIAFLAVGLGVSACGTALLSLLAKRVAPERRAAAAATAWVMMIAGFAITAGTAGRFLEPFTPERLVQVSAAVSGIALAVTLLALAGLEGVVVGRAPAGSRAPFLRALTETWRDPAARRFTVFVFASMLAYSLQDLILEPFAGLAFGLGPGATTRLSGVQHGGALAGMLLAALAGRQVAGIAFGSLRAWMVGGCLASAAALLGLALAASGAADWPLRVNVFLLGVANGAFSIAAIATMMSLAGADAASREGLRVGLWGAAQAIGFAAGGVLGPLLVDLLQWCSVGTVAAYGLVFGAEASLFLVAAGIAARMGGPAPAARAGWLRPQPLGDGR